METTALWKGARQYGTDLVGELEVPLLLPRAGLSADQVAALNGLRIVGRREPVDPSRVVAMIDAGGFRCRAVKR